MKTNLVKLRQKSNLVRNYVNSYKPTLHSLQKHRILKKLADNEDIVIIRPDKGSYVEKRSLHKEII